jgi:hypothetical protein
MPEDPIAFPSQPVNKKGPQPIEITGFGLGESRPAIEESEPAVAAKSPETPVKE